MTQPTRLDRPWPWLALLVPYAALVVAAGLVAASCSEPPHRELRQAAVAIDAAEVAGAPEHAPEAYAAARASLARAEALADERDYRQALNFALDASERAQEAARQATDLQARAAVGLDAALEAVEAQADEARGQLAAAEAARLPARAVRPLAEAIAAADVVMQEARALDGARQPAVLVEELDGAGAAIQAAVDEVNRALGARGGSR